jgi:hypothetical protein
MSGLDELAAALRQLAETNRRLAQDLADIRAAIFEPPEEEGCRYCDEGRSHTSELCKRSGGEG